MRKIALSNLSILGTSLFQGPGAAWSLAQASGFNAMKVNPLRGWDLKKILKAEIPVTAFEAPWRYTFGETLLTALRGEPRALLFDPILFGYDSAAVKACAYAYGFPPETIAVDWPENIPCGCKTAIETDSDKRKMWSIYSSPRLVFDTWHMRGYSQGKPIYPGFVLEQIVAIDVQTRDLSEWQSFFCGRDCLLDEQLKILAQTSESVSVALEISPFQLKALATKNSLSIKNTLWTLWQKIHLVLK